MTKQYAKCIHEPRGDNGLEGFTLDEVYKTILCKNATGRYYRVYLSSTYYETCGPTVFKRYFTLTDPN